MFNKVDGTRACAFFALALTLAGCGGSGGGGDPSNAAPVSSAGADQTVDEQDPVTLSGSGQDSDGTVTSFLWTQLTGRTVTLSDASTATATFTAPALSAPETLRFQLMVTDNGNSIGTDTVDITVNPVVGLNNPPLANAGADQTVAELSNVTLSGAGSTDADGSIQAYQWQQQSGPNVVLSNADTDTASFTSPDVAGTDDLVFELTVTDNEGASASASVTVTVVENLIVTISGRVTFDLVPAETGPVRLNYLNTQARPARGVTVQLIEGASTVVDTAVTDANGDYSLTGTGGTDVFLRARAEMLQGAPGWDVRVVDNTQGNALYVMDGAPFNTGGADSSVDLHAPSGWTGAFYGGPRVAAPFAAMDVVYEAMQFVLSADATANFPPLVLHWSPNNVNTFGATGPDPASGQIGTSFFRSGPGGGIFLLGEENDDTEEYDRHVIAHEWGHYFENNFSRSDSIGGPHTLDDQLDMRVAFGEGFGNAISAMITGDPVYKDTGGALQGSGFSFSMEGTAQTRPGWFNEFSIQEILWDLFDPINDDAIQLGFGPLYDVLIDQQRDTVALTSIFPFIDALKTDLPGSAAAIDGLVSTYSIDTIVDEFGSTETNSGYPANADVLPIYSDLAVGGSVNVCSTNDFGMGATGAVNKLGSRRYLTFNAAATGTYTISATTTEAPAGAPPDTQPDPDMLLHRMGPVAIFDDAPTVACSLADLASCVESATGVLPAGDYVLEVYEWTNTNDNGDPEPPIGRTCFDVRVTSP